MRAPPSPVVGSRARARLKFILVAVLSSQQAWGVWAGSVRNLISATLTRRPNELEVRSVLSTLVDLVVLYRGESLVLS